MKKKGKKESRVRISKYTHREQENINKVKRNKVFTNIHIYIYISMFRGKDKKVYEIANQINEDRSN